MAGTGLKEVVFELRGEQARAPHLGCIKRSRTLRSEGVSVFVDPSRAWEVNLLRGDPEEIGRFREVLQGPPYPSTLRLEELQGGDSWLFYLFEWTRPRDGMGVSVRHVFHDVVAGSGALQHHVGPGRSVFSALGFEPEPLTRFYDRAERELRDYYDVRLVHAGEPRLVPSGLATMDAGDLALARAALRAGYFEEPRRVSIRDLGALEGKGKTAIAHRLRRIERLGVRALLGLEEHEGRHRGS